MAEHRVGLRRISISDFPDDVLDQIFGKLPLSSQRESKAVCKHWKARVSSIKTRVEEGWILVYCTDHFIWYNVHQNRWVKKMCIASLALPIRYPFLICVFKELFFFSEQVVNISNHWQGPICCWNAVTGESRVLDIDPVPVREPPGKTQLGAYTDNKTGELKLLYHICERHGNRARLLRCEVDKGGAWVEEIPYTTQFRIPNMKNLTPSNRVVTFESLDIIDNDGFVQSNVKFHLYDVDKVSFEELSFPLESLSRESVFALKLERFHFPAHGLFFIAESSKFSVLVFRCLPEEHQVELVSEESAPYVTTQLHCSDGVDNIWSLFPGSSVMFQFNVPSKTWTTLPSSALCQNYSYECLHTTF